MILAAVACIGLSKPSFELELSRRAFGVNVNLLFTGLFFTIVFVSPILIAFLYRSFFDHLTQDIEAKEKYGEFIAGLNTLRQGKYVILFPVLG